VKPDLSQLRDIHLPPPVPWWPPAPGWWALLAMVLILSALGGWIYVLRRRGRWRGAALEELARLRGAAPELAFRELSVLLRRVAISRFPRHEAAALTGEAWLSFLDRGLGGTEFRSGAGRALLSGPYAREAEWDAAALFDLCERWIKHLPARGAS
jgi:hypothetical protein